MKYCFNKCITCMKLWPEYSYYNVYPPSRLYNMEPIFDLLWFNIINQMNFNLTVNSQSVVGG